MTSPGFQAHDHARCVSDGMEAALSYCEKNGLKFTPVRQRVLDILLSEHKAMGAYDILAILAEEGYASQPPVVLPKRQSRIASDRASLSLSPIEIWFMSYQTLSC